ncbi:MAG: DUF2807 domain-containing protein [Flavobacteriaceae bacterium]|nr:MAG: DUF2807 domain-containing protein [Flavobacteriaceae bacterium]
MKKLITICIILLSSTVLQAQFFSKKITGNKQEIKTTRNTPEYDGIVVLGSFDVKLVKGTEGNLTIHIEENLAPYLITEVSKGKLTIRWKKGIHIRTKKHVLIEVPIQSIAALSLIGSGNIYTDETIKEETFKISISGSGDIMLTLDTDLTKSSIAGSGNIKLKGISKKLKCAVSGSGGFYGKDFKCKNVHVSIAGSGDAAVFASDKLSASIAGSGDISYYGNPTTEDINVSGSGKVSMH